jgi:hypothetical protein
MYSSIPIEPLIQSSLECRLGNKFASKAIVLNSNKISCDLNVSKEEVLSVWYNGNQSFALSSNDIDLMYFGKFKTFSDNAGAKNISYNPNSSQIGLLSISNSIQVDLEVGTLPLIYQSRVSCVLNGTKMISSLSTKDTFNCQIYSTKDSVYMVGLIFNYPNLFEISNTTSVFHEKMTIEMKGNQLNKNDVVQVQLDTNQLISSKFLRNDCGDLIVTYDDKVIDRQVTNCASTSTLIKFKMEENTQNSTRYSIYYSNPYQITSNNAISGTIKNLNYTMTSVNNTILLLSSNELIYRGIPKLQIQSIYPQLTLLGTKNVSITSNLNLNNFNLLNFEIYNGTQYYQAIRVSNIFSSYLTSQYAAVMNISIFAVYKKTNEKLLISDFVQFYFWSKIHLINI